MGIGAHVPDLVRESIILAARRADRVVDSYRDQQPSADVLAFKAKMEELDQTTKDLCEQLKIHDGQISRLLMQRLSAGVVSQNQCAPE